ncbi:MAG TPA: hypothetical protein VGK57_18925 [Candidatus Binatia bacterium]|jgi:hypothetical protein
MLQPPYGASLVKRMDDVMAWQSKSSKNALALAVSQLLILG